MNFVESELLIRKIASSNRYRWYRAKYRHCKLGKTPASSPTLQDKLLQHSAQFPQLPNMNFVERKQPIPKIDSSSPYRRNQSRYGRYKPSETPPPPPPHESTNTGEQFRAQFLGIRSEPSISGDFREAHFGEKKPKQKKGGKRKERKEMWQRCRRTKQSSVSRRVSNLDSKSNWNKSKRLLFRCVSNQTEQAPSPVPTHKPTQPHSVAHWLFPFFNAFIHWLIDGVGLFIPQSDGASSSNSFIFVVVVVVVVVDFGFETTIDESMG